MPPADGAGPPTQASIIITSYNYGPYVAEAIDSALNQTYSAVEVIVVDDGSTDDSPHVMDRYHDRLAAAVVKENGGQASAFNVGVARSRGEVILFLDSDDALMPDAVETAVAEFRADPQLVNVHWPLWQMDAQSRRSERLFPDRPDTILRQGDLLDAVVREGPGYVNAPPTSGNAWSRRYIERVFPMPEPEYVTCPDSYLLLLAPLYGRLKTVHKPRALYRIHGRNNINAVRTAEKIRFNNHHRSILAEHLRRIGIEADPDRWNRQFRADLQRQLEMEQWQQQTARAADDLAAHLPQGATFILVDQGQVVGLPTEHWRAIPFLERDGRYFGPPPSDEIAVRELERMRAEGAQFMAFTWPAFWWLNHYAGLAAHLESRYPRVADTDQIRLFDLRREARFT